MYKCMLYVNNWEIELSLITAKSIFDGLILHAPDDKFVICKSAIDGEPFPFNELWFQYKDIKKIVIMEVNDNERIN